MLLASSSWSFLFKLYQNILRKYLLTYLWFFSSFFSVSFARSLYFSNSLSRQTSARFSKGALTSAFDFMVLTWTRCFVVLALLDHREGYHYNSICLPFATKLEYIWNKMKYIFIYWQKIKTRCFFFQYFKISVSLETLFLLAFFTFFFSILKTILDFT